ncbi:flagellar hook-basal body complex protein FliE [Sulfitobacter sp. LCG007]
MDMKAISAIRKYSDARPATEPRPVDSGIGGVFGDAAMDFAQTLAQSEDLSKASMIGDADPHALVQALAQTELAVETAVTVRNKVVEAYQEILRMPV